MLVRNVKSGKFLNASGRWTKRVETAWNFPNPLNAIYMCLAKNVKEPELILRYENDVMDRCVRLNVR